MPVHVKVGKLENECEQVAIGSAFISDWLRKKQEVFLFSQLEGIATQNQCYYEGAFDTRLKALYSGLSLNGQHLCKTDT